MIKLNIGSHCYSEARQKLERTQLLFRTEIFSGEDIAEDIEGNRIGNLVELDQYIENHILMKERLIKDYSQYFDTIQIT